MIVEFIDAHREEHGVEPICRVLTETGAKIAPSTYYTHRTRPPSARSVTDAATTAVIEKVHAENYGSTAPARCMPKCAGRAIRWPGAPSSD